MYFFLIKDFSKNEKSSVFVCIFQWLLNPILPNNMRTLLKLSDETPPLKSAEKTLSHHFEPKALKVFFIKTT
jgi:hypothetical protein